MKKTLVIGGEGPKRLLLEEMKEQYRLDDDRVELLGAVPHNQVRDVLCRGHIFLNSSLTESFCIALLEASSCGLFVVSTRVGGVPEVLPDDMIQFSQEASPSALALAVDEALPMLSRTFQPPRDFHTRVRSMYSWHDVAERTECVYERVKSQTGCGRTTNDDFLARLKKYQGTGPFAGILAMALSTLLYLYLQFLEWQTPASSIPRAKSMVHTLFS